MCKKTSYNHHFLDNAILNSGIMGKVVRWRERVHDNTLTFYEIYKHMDVHYVLENFVSVRLTSMYESYGDMGGEKKSKF